MRNSRRVAQSVENAFRAVTHSTGSSRCSSVVGTRREGASMADEPDKPKLVSLSERRNARAKAEDDELLWGLAERLAARAKAAEEAGDHEMAVEMRAASEAVHAADHLNL